MEETLETIIRIIIAIVTIITGICAIFEALNKMRKRCNYSGTPDLTIN